MLTKAFRTVGLCLVGLSLLPAIAGAEIIYDNSGVYQTNFYPSTFEYGDEVRLSGTARVVTNFTFEYFGDFVPQGDETARLRIYKNDGPGQFPAPGTLLFDTGPFPIVRGQNAVPITGIAIEVPNTVTWSVQFGGLSWVPGDQAGLVFYHPPSVGSSFRDFWLKAPAWALAAFPEFNPIANFGARVYATDTIPPAPIRLAALGKVSPDTFQLQVVGASNQTVVLQASADLVNWLPLSTNRFSSNSLTLLDSSAAMVTNRFYRALVAH